MINLTIRIMWCVLKKTAVLLYHPLYLFIITFMFYILMFSCGVLVENSGMEHTIIIIFQGFLGNHIGAPCGAFVVLSCTVVH